MTELETIEYAKMFIDKMANGIDPITDKPVPEQDTINNVRISRCLFFVSDVLRRVIENGGTEHRAIGPSQHMKKVPFALTAEQAARFAYSEQPLKISEIVRRINSLIDTDTMAPLSVTSVTGWLVGIGLLEQKQTADGHTAKTPTEEGKACGITTVLRSNRSSTYETVCYDVNAQHFLLDNLDAIIAARAGRTDMQGQPWSEEDNRILVEQFGKGAALKEIAAALRRTAGAVRAHAEKLGLIKP